VKRPWVIFALVGGAFLALYVWAVWDTDGAGAAGGRTAPPRPPRVFEGRVVGAADAEVELFEDEEDGFVALGRTKPDGTFELTWRPEATTRVDRLFVAAKAEGFARTIAPVRPGGTVIRLARPVAVEGRVVRLDGTPVPDTPVACCVRHDASGRLTRAGALGRFVFEDVAEGAELDLLVDGRLLDRRFRAGDACTLHLGPGQPVTLVVTGPKGAPVAGAKSRLPLPRGLRAHGTVHEADGEGRVVLPQVSEGGGVFVEVFAEGFLPAEVAAWAGWETRLALWPAHDVDLIVWDGWNRRAVEGAELEVDPEWEQTGRVVRRFPVRPGDGAGRYRLRLPKCRVGLRVRAPGYGAEKAWVAKDESRERVQLTPPRATFATLVLRAAKGTPDLPLIVAEESGGWLQRVALADGRASLLVPPGRDLQVGSPHAADGMWVHKHPVPALKERERRVVPVGARPAVKVAIEVEPPVSAGVSVADRAYGDALPPLEVPLRDGKAELWVPPLRKVRIEFTPPGNYFPYEGEFETEHEDLTWIVRLHRSAGVQASVRDAGGNPVAFAHARVWEPGYGGRMELRGRPRERKATADGELLLTGMREGRAAIEVSAPGFRTWRSASLVLKKGEVADLGEVALVPAGVFEGRVVGPDGPVAGVHVRVLAPRVARLAMPGGGERDVYDLTESTLGDAVTGPHGRFRVRDATPRDPVLALYPPPETGLCDAAFRPGDDLTLSRTSRVELHVPGSLRGVYHLIAPSAAVLIKNDPPLSLRPLPLVVPAGRRSLYIHLRDGRWAAPIAELEPGRTARLAPDYRR